MKKIDDFGPFMFMGEPCVVVSTRYMDSVDDISIYKGKIMYLRSGYQMYRSHNYLSPKPYIRIGEHKMEYESVFIAHYKTTEGVPITYAGRTPGKALGHVRKAMKRMMLNTMFSTKERF